jgi:hypothetical protein
MSIIYFFNYYEYWRFFCCRIDFHEFTSLIEKRFLKDFHVLDENKNGVIPITTVKGAWEKLGVS